MSVGIAGGLYWSVGAESVDMTLVDLVLHLFRPGSLWEIFVAGLPYAISVIAILGAHEMGHYLACRYYRIPATLPFFLPAPPPLPLGTFGAVIRIRGIIPNRRALFDVAAAGPIAGFLVTLPVLWLGIRTSPEAVPIQTSDFAYGESVLVALLRTMLDRHETIQMNGLWGAGWVGLLVTSLNLFPVGQLDGGHAVYSISRRVHRHLSRLTLAVVGLLMVLQVVYYLQFPSYVIWFAILFWMRDRHPRLADESAPLGMTRILIAFALLAIFALCFMPIPIRIL